MMKELLLEYGVDYDKGLKSCMGDLSFYQSILSAFLQDECFAKARKAYSNKAYHELFDCMHELKGVSGNIALTDLYQITVSLVELLRNDIGEESEIGRLFQAADEAYKRACEGIYMVVSER